jgi:hypothetical protein
MSSGCELVNLWILLFVNGYSEYSDYFILWLRNKTTRGIEKGSPFIHKITFFIITGSYAMSSQCAVIPALTCCNVSSKMRS